MHGALTSLRTTLKSNAIFTAGSAALLIIAAGPIGDLLGTDRTGLIRVVGILLGVFAVDVALLGRARADRLVPGALAVAVADVAWVVGSVVTIALGWYSSAGTVAVLGAAAVVAGFAFLELRFWRRASRARSTVEALEATMAT